jgi:hypothetical protein
MQVKPWQPSLLRKCFTSKQALVCDAPRHDAHFVPEVDGLGERKVHAAVAVPLLTPVGAAIGVVQARVRD